MRLIIRLHATNVASDFVTHRCNDVADAIVEALLKDKIPSLTYPRDGNRWRDPVVFDIGEVFEDELAARIVERLASILAVRREEHSLGQDDALSEGAEERPSESRSRVPTPRIGRGRLKEKQIAPPSNVPTPHFRVDTFRGIGRDRSKSIDDVKVPAENAAPSLAGGNDPMQSQESIAVHGVGLILLWPLLPQLLRIVGLQLGANASPRERCEASAWMLAIVTGRWGADAATITFSNVLCGLPPEISPLIEPPDSVTWQRFEAWCETLPQQMPGWCRCSVGDVREMFLSRGGALSEEASGWILRVEAEAADVLLHDCPWPHTPVLLPWLPAPLRVDWRVPTFGDFAEN